MTQYADADELLAMYTFDENDNELKELNERGRVPLPVIRENIKDCIVPDVEPVVRCKDCVYAHPLKDSKYDYLCRYWNGHSCNQNQFCSQGKKRKNEK